MNILVTGANGFIGSNIIDLLSNNTDFNFFKGTRHNIDLCSIDSVEKYLDENQIDTVIHCAIEGGSRLKQDSSYDMDINLAMYYNLLQHKPHFDKLIHFGSGAELYSQDTPYGLSKHVIRESILGQDNFYNLRIFAVFDENELNTRFIKTNIKNYINKQPLEFY